MTTFDGLSTSKGSGATPPAGPQEPQSGAPAARPTPHRMEMI